MEKEKERPLRRKQHETIEDHRTRSEQAGELNMYKISTDLAIKVILT
jgi:hypothetical protein